MKVTLTLILAFSFAGIFAQPIVLSQQQADSQGMSRRFEMYQKSGSETVSETPFSVQTHIRNAFRKSLEIDKLPDIAFSCSLLLNENGRPDYLIYRIQNARSPVEELSYNIDSIAAVLQKQLPDKLSGFVSKRYMGKKSQVQVYAAFGEIPRAAKKDSLITGMADALAAVDTLRVKTLNLTQNLLEEIPEVIYRFPNLEVLFLGDNDIEAGAFKMERLSKLRHLDLSKNALKNNGIIFSKNKTLKHLNLQKNALTDIPVGVRSCRALETLWLGGNAMNTLNNGSFRKLKSLKDLNLYRSGIAVLPAGIKKLKNLTVLDLYYNHLKSLPKSIVRLKNLDQLALSNNELTALPARIDKLKKVHTLYAHHNRLSTLPASIVRMENLKILDLGYNWFTRFPVELVSFVRLSELDLSSNNFPEFPEQLLQIKQLDKLYLRGNPFLSGDTADKYTSQFSELKSRNIEVSY